MAGFQCYGIVSLHQGSQLDNTIALFASARRNGNTGKLIDWIAAELGIDVLDLSIEYLGTKFGGYLYAKCENGFIADEYKKC